MGKRDTRLTAGWILMLLIVIVRLLFNLRPRVATIYFDELFYLELAQNIWHHGALSVYHLPLNFTKLLYPLLISPFYAIQNAEIRMIAIRGFNSLLISSSIIPAYLLARKFIPSGKKLLAAVSLLMLSPNMMFAYTYMAENLYFPLVLWGMLWIYDLLTDDRLCFRLIAGIWCVLLYFTKEVALAFFTACLIAQIYTAVTGKQPFSVAARSLGCFLLSSILPIVAFRFLLFRQMPYSYTYQLSHASMNSAPTLFYVIYTSVTVLVFFLLSCFFIPTVIPLMGWSKLMPTAKKLFVFSIGYILCISAGIGYGISLYESFPNLTGMNIHLRYYLAAAYPGLLLYLSASPQGVPAIGRRRLIITFASALFMVLIMVYPEVALLPMNAPLLQYMNGLNSIYFRPALIVKILSVIVILVSVYLLCCRRQGLPRKAVLCLFVGMELFSTCAVGSCLERNSRLPDSIQTEELNALDRYLDTLEGDILMIPDDLLSTEWKAVNTYLDEDYYVLSSADLRSARADLAEPNRIRLSDTSFPNPLYPFMPAEQQTIPRADYIVLLSPSVHLQDGAYRNITPEDVRFCQIFASDDAEYLLLKDISHYEPGTEIRFSAEDVSSCENYMVSGFSFPESGFIWSEGNETILKLSLPGEDLTDYEATWTWMMTLGEQPCQITAGDQTLFDGILGHEGNELTFAIPAETLDEDNTLTLHFFFPGAMSPGSGDERLLAVAFQSLKLEQK